MKVKVFAEVREVLIVKYNEIKELNKDKKEKKDDEDDDEKKGKTTSDDGKDDALKEGNKEFKLDEKYNVLDQLAIDEKEGYAPDSEIFMVKLVGLQDEWRKMKASKKQ